MQDVNTRAATEGWQLAEVIDNGTSAPYFAIFGLGGLSNVAALAKVLTLARQNSEFHINVLRTVAHSRVRPSRPTRKKK